MDTDFSAAVVCRDLAAIESELIFLKALMINVEASPFFGNTFCSCPVYTLFPLGRTSYLRCLPPALCGVISYLFLSLGFGDSADKTHAEQCLWTFVLELEAGFVL